MLFITITILIPFVFALGVLISPLWPVSRKNSSCESIRKKNMKKFLTFLLCTTFISAIGSFLLYYLGTRSMYSNEIWSFRIDKIKHEERWSEREMRTRQVPSGTDSKGNITYRTETYYVTEYYGPYWKACDEYGTVHHISQKIYNYWKNIWGNQKKVGRHKGSSAGFDRCISGDIYECYWNGEREKIYPFSVIHSYKNKIRCSNSVMRYREPTPELEEKYPRPADTKNLNPIIGYGMNFTYDEQLKLRRVNAELGRKHQVHVLLLVFNKQDRSVVDDVLSAWQGPNKNELVIFVGVGNDRNVKWIDVHSWMDDTTIHGVIRDQMVNKILSIDGLSDILYKAIPEHWDRKEFEDFEYINVDIHWAWFMGSFVFAVVASISSFLVINKVFVVYF
ncbi:MAG: hypothetical protein ACOC80_13945 [Petrotogales bacterium]